MWKRARAFLEISTTVLVVGALAFAGTSTVLSHTQRETRLGDVLLTASQDFTITSSISDSASTENLALLYPGVQRYLWYTAHNPLNVPITVTTMSISATTPPAGCPTSNLDLSGTTYNGSLVVPAHGTNSVAVPISLKETGSNQDSCQTKTFTFTYTGSAQYTEVYSTGTVVASSQNPSTVGQLVTYTATVTATATGGQDPVPSSPTGTVTFRDNSIPIGVCTNVPVSSFSTTVATATCAVTYASTAGSPHPITAVYSNTDGNFTGSTSPVLSQVVQAALPGTSTVLTSAPNPSAQGSPVTLTATVTKTSGSGTPTGTVTFFTGTPASPGATLGTGTISGGKATLTTSTLPVGPTSLFAKYNGSSTFAASTSAAITHTVIALPAACTPGTYNLVVATGSSVSGTNGNDFIYAPGSTNRTISSGNGNDCIQAGDGNNTITGGNGNNVIVAGNGTNTITSGNGTNKIVAGNGKNTITAGNGSNSITAGNGSNNKITAGNGANTIVLGTGSNNTVTLGNGANTITTLGSNNTITAGNGKNNVFLGGGTNNKFTGGKKNNNTCHFPSLPASVYSPTLVNCTAVSP